LNSSLAGQQSSYFLLVGFIDQTRFSQASFPLAGLAAQQVSPVSFASFEFSSTCFLESLGCCSVAFFLGQLTILRPA
jgi:hypothetical protein